VEPESDFMTWKSRISEVEMEAQKIMKRFMDKCAAYQASISVAVINLMLTKLFWTSVITAGNRVKKIQLQISA
jgi:hypothetical protein